MSENEMFQKTLEYVLRTPKSESQVRRWLFSKRTQGSFLDVDSIISRLKELGYVNDAEYARNFAQVKQEKIGKKAIRQKLVQKGIETSLVDSEVARIDDQTDLAQRLLEKYMRNKQCDAKTLQKLYRYLCGKGLDYDTINFVIKNSFKGGQEDDRD